MALTRLKQLREEAVLTVHELAEASGVSDDTISKIENGQRVARPNTLRKLARALDVSPQELRRPAKTEELASAGKAEAPETGPSGREAPIFDVVHDAALRQARQDSQAFNRAAESGQAQTYFMRHDAEAMKNLLMRPRGDIAEAYIDLMHDYVRLEHENARLRQEAEAARDRSGAANS
jgi:transcriptional regulator with XRE-family HTH domain